MNETYISVVTQELITCGTLLGPLPLSSGTPDSLAVLTWRCVDDLHISKQILKVTVRDQTSSRGVLKTPAWLAHILPARNAEEQTLEVVVKSGQLYFRALRDVNDGEELRAWFGQDLADILRLPMIPSKESEGEKRYECMLCQEQFDNPFPVVAHLMYRCRRKNGHMSIPTTQPFRKKNGGRVKNFDIATLTDMNDNDSFEEENPENLTVTDTPPRPPSRDSIPEYTDHSSPKKRRRLDDFRSSDDLKQSPKSSSVDSKSEHSAFSSAVSSGLSSGAHPSEGNGSSAFKKVDKSSSVQGLFPGVDPRELMMHHSGSNAFSPFSYALPPTVVTSSLAVSTHPSLTTPSNVHLSSGFGPSSLQQQLKMAEDLKMMRKQLPGMGADPGYHELTAMMTFNGSRMPGGGGPGGGLPFHKPQAMDGYPGKAGFPTPLLPYLPPSLAALSFPTQNWCAKCNASFRMTSDLVYHMRSHHKRESDPQKLKREEKLRCHICNETFRERHHLTRHMTSHQ